MTKQYTPQQAREMVGLALDHGTTARVVNSLADQVEALTAWALVAASKKPFKGRVRTSKPRLGMTGADLTCAHDINGDAINELIQCRAERDAHQTDALSYRKLLDEEIENEHLRQKLEAAKELLAIFLEPSEVVEVVALVDEAIPRQRAESES